MKPIMFTLAFVLLLPAHMSAMEGSNEPSEIIVDSKKTGHSHAEIAQKAVRLAYGRNNDYLERVLVRKLDKKKRTKKIIPISRVYQGPRPYKLKQKLISHADKAQEESLKLLDSDNPIEKIGEFSEQVQPVFQWILNSVLVEKLEDRIHLRNTECWKYINGALAVVLPVAVGILEYFLVYRFSPQHSYNDSLSS